MKQYELIVSANVDTNVTETPPITIADIDKNSDTARLHTSMQNIAQTQIEPQVMWYLFRMNVNSKSEIHFFAG